MSSKDVATTVADAPPDFDLNSVDSSGIHLFTAKVCSSTCSICVADLTIPDGVVDKHLVPYVSNARYATANEVYS